MLKFIEIFLLVLMQISIGWCTVDCHP